MLVIVCPGQGSQTPGFLTPWLELPGFRDRMRWFSAVADMDLVKHGTESDQATITDTAVAQPLLVASGLTSLLALFSHPADGFRAVAGGGGHSVGEITAASAAGVISAEQALVFARERGRAMAQASAARPTGMAAVMKGEPAEVLASIEKHGLTAANHNGAGQVVAAGTLEQIEALRNDPPAGARVIPLKVAGAFHTHHMEPAVDLLRGYSNAMSTRDPRSRVVSNADGTVVHDGREVLRRLVDQVSNPVRWDACMETFMDMGVTGLIEIPPAGTLAGLAKRAMPGVEVLALKTPEDLPKAHEMIAEHGTTADAVDDPTWRIAIAPAKGLISHDNTAAGSRVEAGATVATVQTRRGEEPVIAPYGGSVVEWLSEDGDPVAPGQPILRIYPEDEQ